MTNEELKALVEQLKTLAHNELQRSDYILVNEAIQAIRQLAKEVLCEKCHPDMPPKKDCSQCHGTGKKYNLEG